MELARGTLGRRVLRWVQSQGQEICHDTKENQQLSVLLDELRPIFPEIEQVHAWFTYRQANQPPPLSEHDGELWKDCTLDVGTLYAIGISLEALDAGHDYGVLVILHELTHVLLDGGEHDRHFHSVLNDLLDRYNRATGQSVKNDYFGFEMRHDAREIPASWFANPPAKLPQEGRRFRTEAVDP